MSSERVIRVVLTGSSAGAVRAFTEAGAAAEKTQTKFERMQAVGRGMTSVGRSMTMIAAPVVALGAYAIKTAASFQQSMTMIRTQAGASQTEVNNMSKAILNMAPSLGTGSGALADSLYHVESAGFRGATALKIMTTAAQAAKISGANLTDTTTALTASVFSGIKGAQNYTSAMGLLNATVGVGDMKMQDLNEAFAGPMLATVKGYGLSLTDVGAALATFGDLNIRGADASTQLRMAVQYMAKPAKTAGTLLGQLGLTTHSFSDAMAKGGLLPALKLLQDRLTSAGVKGNQMASVISDLFTKKGAAGVTILENSLSKLESKYPAMAKGATSFGAAWQTTQKNVSFQFDKLKATGEVALVHLGDALMPIVVKYLPPLVKGISAVVKWVMHLPKPVKDAVIGFTAFLAIGGPILMFFGGLVTAIGTVGSAFAALRAMTFLTSMAMKASIVGIVVFALIELVTHFQQVKVFVNSVFRGLGIMARAFASALASVFSGIYNVITWPFRKAFAFIKGALRAIASIPGQVVHGAGSVLSSATFGLLHSGGPVRTHFASGGPTGTDTIPGWLSPGEFVLNKATTARIGAGNLSRLNDGGQLTGSGSGVLTADVIVPFNVDGRKLTQAVLRVSLQKAARGPTSLTGGGLMTGSVSG
jgi:TP901 family phage tail tape measure protein